MPGPPQPFLRSLSTFSSNSGHHLSLLAHNGSLSLLSSFPCSSCIGKASALSHTPAEAGQRCVSPQDEKPGTGVPGSGSWPAPPLTRARRHHTRKLPAVTAVGSAPLGVWSPAPRSARLWEQPSPRTGGSWCTSSPAPCSSEGGLSGAGCSWALGSPHGGGVLLAHSGGRLLGVLLVPLTLDRSSLRSPLRSLTCIQSFASASASGGTLPKTVDLGFSF